MSRLWVSYTFFALGLMLLFSSDQSIWAEATKEHKEIQVLVNREGNEDAVFDLIINGEKISFSVPELGDGETKTFTTESGNEIVVRFDEGQYIIKSNGEDLNIPIFALQDSESKEALHSVITRIHKAVETDDVIRILAADLPEDVSLAILDAVKGVLTSYGIDKQVQLNKMNFQFKSGNNFIWHNKDEDNLEGNIDIQVHTDANGKEHKKIMIIEKKEVKEEPN